MTARINAAKLQSQIEELKSIIEESENIVFFGGAGVSTESGIPDFRSENGLYSTKSKYGLSPEEILTHSFFVRDPFTFFDYYKNNFVVANAKPNKAHVVLSQLERQGKLKAIITQNVDNLHQAAGSKKVYELHGSAYRNYCSKCGKFYDINYILDESNCEPNRKHPEMLGVPKCSCGGIVKPDVVLYEESLDEDCINNAVNAIQQADTLIIGGTSLVVYPAAGFVQYFGGKHLVIINMAKTNADKNADLAIHAPIGEVLQAAVE